MFREIDLDFEEAMTRMGKVGKRLRHFIEDAVQPPAIRKGRMRIRGEQSVSRT
ncbi:hypothetical protein [Methylocaldum szegediense]|uniref:Uncharacterized protein n=1 Tax=Methylocaldum szegediense TaxID=73780 RepID=A0ABM9I187_9GAMM|nr:hypothetical protein [Methylocaldum szegediense]CAI8822347.1 protein of unknown function [Methylocaldum szegediense]